MVPQTFTYRPQLAHGIFVKAFSAKVDALVKRLTPRPHVLSSIGLILVGLGIPLLMVLEAIPATLFLGLAGTGLIAVGGLLVLCHI